ncbi:MAG: ribonuclease D [Alphaproteobacteria bacterium]|nr:ribonuclease D [Alphaproteobacteria bacterium]
MAITLLQNDLDDAWLKKLTAAGSVAVDSETMGLVVPRDRLCLVQLSAGDGQAVAVQFTNHDNPTHHHYQAPKLITLLTNPKVMKIMHYGRFDMAVFDYYLGAMAQPVYCTKIAARLVRTSTDQHGLASLVRDLLGVDMDKEKQTSDWGQATLSSSQLAYAAADVLYLHRLKEKLEQLALREGRTQLIEACHQFLPTRVRLDLKGWAEMDIFAHH